MWTERGRSRERSTGTADREQAQIALAEFLQQRGGEPAPVIQLGPRNRHAQRVSPTARPKVAAPERIAYAVLALTDFFEGNSVADVTPQTCARYAEKRGRSAGTVRRELGVLRAAIKYALKRAASPVRSRSNCPNARNRATDG